MDNKKRMRLVIALICGSLLSVTGCVASKAGGDLEEQDFMDYSFEGKNLVAVSGFSASDNDVLPAADSAAEEHEAQTGADNTEDGALLETTEDAGTDGGSGEQETEETEDPLSGLTAVAQVEKWVNVRTEPNTESRIVGKIYNNCAATIIDEVDGENGTWYYMTSGNVTGYIKSEYFIVGEEAESLREEIGITYARVLAENLRVRSTPDLTTNDNIVTMYPMGTEVVVLSHDSEWALIETDASSTGYVHVSCIEMWTEFDVAITLEEEAQAQAEQAAAEEAARAAEEAYRQLLEQQQAQAEETTAAPAQTEAPTEAAPAEVPTETAQPVQTQPAETPAPTEAPTTEAPTTAASATEVSDDDVSTALRNAIVAYALQFNGCPYVHGGRSLSQGTDCSGFTNLIYQNFGYNLSWTPAGQAELGTRIDYHDVQPGDLLFYSNSQKYLGHVALYIGNGQIIHAANEQYGICIWDMNYREPLFAVRIIN
jgi:cell wall-associated NlpC family hydrolase